MGFYKRIITYTAAPSKMSFITVGIDTDRVYNKKNPPGGKCTPLFGGGEEIVIYSRKIDSDIVPVAMASTVGTPDSVIVNPPAPAPTLPAPTLTPTSVRSTKKVVTSRPPVVEKPGPSAPNTTRGPLQTGKKHQHANYSTGFW